MAKNNQNIVTRLPVDSITEKGWLFKWTNYVRGYQLRWFVLKNGYFYYYLNEADTFHMCRGSVNISTAFITAEGTHSLKIVSPGLNPIWLKAFSTKDRDCWHKALQISKHPSFESDTDQKTDNISQQSSLGGEDCLNFTKDLKEVSSVLSDLTKCRDEVDKYANIIIGWAILSPRLPTISMGIPLSATAQSEAVANNGRQLQVSVEKMISLVNGCSELMERVTNECKVLVKKEKEYTSHLSDVIDRFAQRQNILEERLAISGQKMTTPNHLSCAKIVQSDDEEEVSNDEEYFSAKEDDSEDVFFSMSAKSTFSTNTVIPVEAAKTNQEDIHQVIAAGNLVNYKRRSRIPDRPEISIDLWGILKKCLGRELTKMPVPVNFSEPLSFLQRITEEMENYHLLDLAANSENRFDEMAYVCAFIISAYSTTKHRIAKPFNPMLGETFEFDSLSDRGWRTIAEQVSHHPPTMAQQTDSVKWRYEHEMTVTSKFRGKYIRVVPTGKCLLTLKTSGNQYSWCRVATTIHNIVVGKLWVDNHGAVEVRNHTTGDYCKVNFHSYSYFSHKSPRLVTGAIYDSEGKLKTSLHGSWDDFLNATVHRENGTLSSPSLLWKCQPIPEENSKCYNYSRFTAELNEPDDLVATTDSRNRPDQRHLEVGEWRLANEIKMALEDKQRAAQKKREESDKRAYQPVWFSRKRNKITDEFMFLYKGGYWNAKMNQDWSMCPDIF